MPAFTTAVASGVFLAAAAGRNCDKVPRDLGIFVVLDVVE
jgi:hypothetical protein